jgi:hypothetical protein
MSKLHVLTVGEVEYSNEYSLPPDTAFLLTDGN